MLSRNGLAAAAACRRVKSAASASAVSWGSRSNFRQTSNSVRTVSHTSDNLLQSFNNKGPSLSLQEAAWATGDNGSRRWYSATSGTEYPEHVRVNIPALSPTMEMGTIISWEKREGDKVSEGDLLCEIETDKATMGFETPEEGYLAKIILPAGSKDMPIGRLLCIITPNAEDVPKFSNFVDDDVAAAGGGGKVPKNGSVQVPEEPIAPRIAPIKVPTGAPSLPPSPPSSRLTGQQPPPGPARMGGGASPPPMASTSRAFASPAAKKVAAERGVDIGLITSGSGMDGMITVRDVENFVPLPAAAGGGAAAPAAAVGATRTAGGMPAAMMVEAGGYSDAELTNMRKVIAKRLQASKMEVPHYYLTVDVEMDEVLKVRSSLNGRFEKDGVKLSVNDFIIKATALACRKVPAVNSAWMDTFIRQFHSCDVSVAVDTGNGLITPIVASADSKGLAEISASVKEMAGRAKQGKLQPHEFQGGTITVSNLGMFGISHFTAIINSPQSCILAVGGTKPRLVPGQGQHRVAQVMTVTLSCDHRVVDGAVGAQWLQQFKKLLEDPQAMLL